MPELAPAAPSLASLAPRFTAEDAVGIARSSFGIVGSASPLDSERDQNFRIDADGARFVLKIANASESRAMLDAQQAAIAHLRATQAASLVPEIVPTTNGSTLADVEREGRTHLAWMIRWIDGRVMARVSYRSPALLQDLGRAAGVLRTGLSSFDHPAVHRDFYWDIAKARETVERDRHLVRDDSVKAALQSLCASFDAATAPLIDRLPRGVVHGDLNDHNILLADDRDPERRWQRVAGIVDFGDMVHTIALGEPAIAVAYVMAESEDPLVDAREVVRGYHSAHPLTEDEIAAVFGLASMRLCASACIAVRQSGDDPDNAYLSVSQSAIARALPRLATIPFALAEAVFREACGLEPSKRSTRVREYLASRPSFAPVMGADLSTTRTIVLDWSIASPMLGADESENAEPLVTERVFAAMADAGVDVAVGRYDEPRLLYVSAAFGAGGRITDERRTVHIGIDLFAVAGSPVFAPLDGVVHAFANNDALCDYGPVIILRHTTDDGIEFFTIYGHLSRESLVGLEVGARVHAGDRIATLGAPPVNGGWTPHLHIQIITDLLGLGTDFPGVSRPAFRSAFKSICPDPNLLLRIPASAFPAPTPAKDETLATRRTRMGGNLSIGYRDPVRVVRGWRQYLFDDEGHRFIDAYNNVPHVGHCHPRVVAAGVEQMRTLNTNTRYPSDVVNAYAERLVALFPEPLSVCYLLNSASEANELALRLARAHTSSKEIVVLDGAYHGNTTTLVDISPYKHAGPGGSGAPEWVHTAPIPDDYRGAFKRDDAKAGVRYGDTVGHAIERAGGRIGAFIAETCPSVGGQIIPPPGYLARAYEHVRAAGGVCIADEVQTGLGRIGTHMWAFEAQGVVPDVVVLGKPLGNGHPIAAVITTRAIADSFDNGMEFFSTFGGNTVSCAIGIAVLDVLRDEGLQAHARDVGDRMLAAMRPMIERHRLVGDVRGSGLFLGVELVRDRETLEPAGAEASFVANRMRERGILLGTDGPHHNVVKIRPPMPISEGDADLIVEELDRALALLG